MLESPSWRLQVGSPAPAISGEVFGYSGYEEHVARPVRRLEIGTPCPTLIIGLGSEFRVSQISSRSTFTCQSLFVGPAALPVIVEHGGEVRCIEVSLSPWAAAAIFGPAEGWPEHAASLNEVWQRAGGELEESLAGLPSWAARFEMLDHIFGVKIPARCAPPTRLRWAWNQVSHLGGDRSGQQIGSKSGLEFSPLHREISRDCWPDSQGTSPSMAISEGEDISGPNLGFAGSGGRFVWLQRPEPPNP